MKEKAKEGETARGEEQEGGLTELGLGGKTPKEGVTSGKTETYG